MRRLFHSPMHVCLIGVLVLSLGINSVVRLVGDLIQGEAGFSLEFFAIFIGLGLLRGSSNYRGFLSALLVMNLVVGGVIFLIVLVKVVFWGEDWGFILGMGAHFLLVGYPYKVLSDLKNDPWFSEGRGKKAPPFLIPMTIILTLSYSIVIEVEEHSRRNEMAEIFRFDLEIIVKNAITGEIMDDVSVTSPEHNFGEVEVPDWMKGTSTSSGESGDAVFTIKGFALSESKFKISREGFESVWTPIDSSTRSPIEVKLNPVDK